MRAIQLRVKPISLKMKKKIRKLALMGLKAKNPAMDSNPKSVMTMTMKWKFPDTH